MFEKKVKETKDVTKKKGKKAPEKKGILGIVLVPLLLTVVLVGAIYLLMGKLSENEILLSDVVVAKDNLRVNAYITPEEVEQYFEVKQMDASLVCKGPGACREDHVCAGYGFYECDLGQVFIRV